MRSQARRLTRRCFLAGVGAAVGDFGTPSHARAQVASEAFRLLRAHPAGASASGGGEAPSASPALRYDGSLPGPTLRAKRGEELRVRLVNALAEPTGVHWHGVRLPNAMDGAPPFTQPAVEPGASFDYRFRPPDAGTFWYHASIAAQVDQGLHGALIVEEAQSVGVDRDLVLVIGTADARVVAPVNGSLRPDFAVRSGERVRLRLINASAARALALRLEGHAPWVMAIDGQPAEPAPAREGRVRLGPGNRIDLFVDMTRAGGTIAPLLMGGVGDEQPIARLVYERGGEQHTSPRAAPPPPLPPNPLPAHIDLRGSLKAELTLANAKPLDPAAAPLFTARRGRAVTLAIRNTSGHAWVVHMHGHSFRLLDRLDDGWKPYWLDTLLVAEQTERIAFVADNPGKWLIDCRMLGRRDAEVRSWFVVS
jgi:FtsP/CotA-like multicopper oxidase with cupredoxin domain